MSLIFYAGILKPCIPLIFSRNIVKHTTEIAALEIMVYYFYLAAIRHSDLQGALHKKELESEKNKLTLLMAQIKPHFINNVLVAVQELCYRSDQSQLRRASLKMGRQRRRQRGFHLCKLR